jgi:glycosyltransferase involved in cell wall biosynthesis
MKIAFVTPWYGPDIPGGAETETRRTAVYLNRAGYDVEILTTCIHHFQADWGKNYHKPGVTMVEGVTVRRFPVQKRDKSAFDAVNWRLMQNLAISPEEEQIYIQEMFRAPALYEFIECHCQDYIFFFIPYMFASTYFGVQICPERSVVIPCLHDESYAYLDIYRHTLPKVNTMIFQVESERLLANKLFGAESEQIRSVVGTGVDTDFLFNGERFRQKYGLTDPFMLYVGRKDRGKNTHLLLAHWNRYMQEYQDGIKLILIGPGKIDIPEAVTDSVIDLGFVPAGDKYDAYAAAEILCQPSTNESFSLVIMESWLTETPVLVNGRCTVTREHCQRSNGGLYFSNYDEFATTTNYLMANPGTARRMGQNGRQYVLDYYQWPTIVEKYRQIIDSIENGEEC